MWFEDGYCDKGVMRGCGSTDAANCSGATITTQATIAAEDVSSATATPTTVSQASTPIDFTTTTSSTGSAALFRAYPDEMIFFFCAYSIFVASICVPQSRIKFLVSLFLPILSRTVFQFSR